MTDIIEVLKKKYYAANGCVIYVTKKEMKAFKKTMLEKSISDGQGMKYFSFGIQGEPPKELRIND